MNCANFSVVGVPANNRRSERPGSKWAFFGKALRIFLMKTFRVFGMRSLRLVVGADANNGNKQTA